MNRRTFLKVAATTGGSFLMNVYFQGCNSGKKDFEPNAFLRIDPDGMVTLTIPRPEMGQGVRTSLAMLLAEELDCEWENIRIEQADLNPEKYGDQYVGGSSSIWDSWEPLRKAGAAARDILVRAAAAKWKADASSCRTLSGRVIHASGREVSYGELTALASTMQARTNIKVKDSSAFRLIGRRIRHLDTHDIVTGRIQFGIDTRAPGMMFAMIERCPVLGGRIRNFDGRRSMKVPGVHAVVRFDADLLPEFGENSPKPASGIAVVATSTWAAMKGREQLIVDWDSREGISTSTDQMRTDAMAHSRNARWTYRLDGDPDRAFAQAHSKIEAVYEVPLLAHATLEPMNCVASVQARSAEIWAPTQNPQSARYVVRMITGLPEQAISIHPTRMGGGFGRRFYSDYVAEATYLSKAVRMPVQVVWNREDDFQHGFYRPAGYYVVRGGVDSAGRPIVWMQHLINASRGHYQKWQPPPGKELKPGEIGRDDYPAGFIPNFKIEYTPLDSLIPRGQWRAVEESSNIFVIQSFLAELAHAAGKDPLEINLELLSGATDVPYYGGRYQAPRLRAVFEVAAAHGDWGKSLAPRWGRGIAGSYSNGAYVAQVAEVEVKPSGELRVHRIIAAVDCGSVVNRSGVEAQVQGGILFALSAALKQKITVEKGCVVQKNFTDYQILRINEAPRIEVHILPSSEPPHGMGEGAVGQTAPAVTNAIFAATGKRLRRLPILSSSSGILEL